MFIRESIHSEALEKQGTSLQLWRYAREVFIPFSYEMKCCLDNFYCCLDNLFQPFGKNFDCNFVVADSSGEKVRYPTGQ